MQSETSFDPLEILSPGKPKCRFVLHLPEGMIVTREQFIALCFQGVPTCSEEEKAGYKRTMLDCRAIVEYFRL